MKLNRNWVVLIILGVGLYLASLEKTVTTTLLLAAGCAYLLNPLAKLLHQRFQFPRILAVGVVFVSLVTVLVWVGIFLGSRMIQESDDFTRETRYILQVLQGQIHSLPEWARSLALDSLDSLRTSLQFAPQRLVPFFPTAMSRVIYVFAFFFAVFYFLIDGENFYTKLIELLPVNWRDEIRVVGGRINKVLGDYLRAEMLLVVIMSTLTFVGLSIMGVRYALIVALFTGFAELIPFVGPVIAGSVAVGVAYFDGITSLGLTSINEALVIIIMYFTLRQLEDLFVIPHVLGRMVKLHPLVVLFAVLAGGELWGPLGFIAAVPIIASARVVGAYLLEKSAQKE